MSEIRAYLEAKAAEPSKEWLRRKPRTTHPQILALVREFQDAGGFYDDDAERYVNEHASDLPAHQHHGATDRDPLVTQLGHEVYIAKGCLKDEAAQAEIDASIADGFSYLGEPFIEPKHGERYTVRFGTRYVGQTVPTFGEPRKVRAHIDGEQRLLLIPRGARKGRRPVEPMLIRNGWADGHV